MTSKEWLEKFYTDDVLLPMSSFGQIFFLILRWKTLSLLYFCFRYSNRILFFVTLSFSLFTLRGCSKLFFEVNLCGKRSFSFPQGWHIIQVLLWFSIKFSSVLKFLHKFTTLTKDWVWLFLNVYDPMVHIAPRNWLCNILCFVK